MPDTYTSQFSGEEIDSALRAAQIISGASTLAELREKLEIRGDTIPVSAGDSTLISEALTKIPTTSGGGVNPNLLDNWYFGRPVNQRNGYYIPAGVKYNTLSWTEAGTTDKAYPVIGYIGQDPLITVNGTNYIVGKSVQVPGYCTTGYTVDRWKNTSDAGAIMIADGKVVLQTTAAYAGITQTIEKTNNFRKKTVTLSVLCEGTLNGTYQAVIWYGNEYRKVLIKNQISSVSFTLPDNNEDILVFVQSNTAASSPISILAIKLELGSTQTLAHQDSSGNWILNEIPDFGEQLARCQRYYFVTNANHFFSGWCTQTDKFLTCIPTPVPLRARPAISVITPGNLLSGTVGAFYSTKAGQYEIENADSAGIKMVVNIDTTALTMGAGVLSDGKYAFSADL